MPMNGGVTLTSNAALSIIILGAIRAHLEDEVMVKPTKDGKMDRRDMVERIASRLMVIVVPENTAQGFVIQNLVVMITVNLVTQKRDTDIDVYCVLILLFIP